MTLARKNAIRLFWSAAAFAGLVLLPAAAVSTAAAGCCGAGLLASMSHSGDGGCCGGSMASAAPAAPVKKTDADLVKEQKAIYPLDTCVVSGEKLGGEMGGPVDYLYKGRLVRFCCKGCIDKFQKEPGKYLKVLDDAVIKAQKPKYPLDTCVVSGDKLGGDMGEPIDYVYQGRLVRFCCKSCIPKFEKDPDTYLKKLGSSGAPATPPAGKGAPDAPAGHHHGS